MPRIKIKDLPGDQKISKDEMKRISGGYSDKEIMLGSAIPNNPFGWDSEEGSSGSSSGDDQSSTLTIPGPDVCKIPAPPSGPVPIPYPNIGKPKK